MSARGPFASVLLVAAVLLAAACSDPAGLAAEPSLPAPTAAPSTTLSSTTTTTAATTTTTEVTVESLPDGHSLAARSDQPLEVYEMPGDAEPFLTLDTTTMLGTPRVVLGVEGPTPEGWLEVLLPVRPNGSTGWIEVADVTLFVVDRSVEVDLGDRSLRVVQEGEVLLETEVAIGGGSSPTPTGRFFVTDSVILTDPGGPWGPHAFGLSAFSDTITEFNGGDGIIGIHGTNQPSSIGQARSLGCVRVPNEVALELAGIISAGVPVEIAE